MVLPGAGAVVLAGDRPLVVIKLKGCFWQIALTKSALKLSDAAAKLYLRKRGARRAVPRPFLSLLGSSEALMG